MTQITDITMRESFCQAEFAGNADNGNGFAIGLPTDTPIQAVRRGEEPFGYEVVKDFGSLVLFRNAQGIRCICGPSDDGPWAVAID